MYKITIIIPLKGREYYTEVFLKENIRHDCFYIFADGSEDDQHKELFQKIKNKNIQYIKYPTDLNMLMFQTKIFKTSLLVKTKYTMTADNDDFINYDGVYKCINFLNKNKDYGFAGGPIFSLNRSHSNILNKQSIISTNSDLHKIKYKIIPEYVDLNKNLDGYENLEGMKRSLSSQIETYYVGYSIFRTEIFSNIRRDLIESNIKDIHFHELFESTFAFYHGKYKHLNSNHYIRLSNVVGSSAGIIKEHLPVRLILEESTRNQLSIFIKYIQKKCNIDQDEANDMVISFFRKRKKYYEHNRFYILFCYYLLRQYYSLKNIKKIISAIILISNIFKK
tara:strand:- start:5553 stop:6560 length:1008 start_codon:yes stop_codon:yes gene_type:complete